ncbi:MAG: hypothetical protein HY752_06210 [Nitrospirae bacterium]|nr:hypothetical protein [Nitrospirota bacterium]
MTKAKHRFPTSPAPEGAGASGNDDLDKTKEGIPFRHFRTDCPFIICLIKT